MQYIGVDLGTSSVKLALVSSEGEILHTVTRDYPVYYPKTGWSEQEPEDWFKEATEGIRELVRACGNKDEIAGISFGGQMHGLVMLDSEDRVIRPAILWNDGRSAAETDYLNRQPGREKLSLYTGNIAFAGFTAPKLLWVYNNEPENFSRIAKLMLPKDYIAYRLTGVHCTDVSDASGTLFFDVKNRSWSEEMLKICHIDRAWLPKIYESHECVGNILPDMADSMGLKRSVKIIAGAGDNAAAAVGNGAVGNGCLNISVGTSGTIFIPSREFLIDSNNALHSFAHADGGYHLMGCMLSAASCNQWWMGITGESDYEKAQSQINGLGENNVYFLPYLMGERSPHNDPCARGAFIGMSMDTDRSKMLQAVLEGVAFGLRDSLEIAREMGISPENARLCGGGAKSPLWRRIIANVLNVEVELPNLQEGPAFGAAILAMTGCGEYGSVAEAAGNIVKVKESVRTETELVKKYEEKYQVFRELYPCIAPVYKRMEVAK